MGTYEVTVVYPDLSYDECRRSLDSLAASPPSGLDGFRRYGDGVTLTYVVTTEFGPELAGRIAVQRAAVTWPHYKLGPVSLDDGQRDLRRRRKEHLADNHPAGQTERRG